MTSFTFTPEQVRSAPLEVRRWIEHEIAATLAALSKSEQDPSQAHAAALAACMPHEAAEVFELIKGNFLLSQVYFELAREMPSSRGSTPLHALSIADILRHTRLADGDRLVDCFTAINQAFHTIRNDPEAMLFGFDQYGHVFIHQTTHDSIRQLCNSCSLPIRQWQEDRPPRQRNRGWQVSRRLTSDRARTSLSTCRVQPASTFESSLK